MIPMFHPAAALHQAALKPAILADFAKLPELLKEARAAQGKPGLEKKNEDVPQQNAKPQQLNMF